MVTGNTPSNETYPTVEELSVEFKENGYMVHDYRKQSGTYSKETVPPSISCNNVSCKQGGFAIEPIIRAMLRTKQTEYRKAIGCQGHEGSSKSQREMRDCLNGLELKISIKYKAETTESEKTS